MPITGPEVVSDLPNSTTKESQPGGRLAACLEDADGAVSGNTVRALRADLERFTGWCGERGLCPLPARAATVVAYVEAMASVHRALQRIGSGAAIISPLDFVSRSCCASGILHSVRLRCD